MSHCFITHLFKKIELIAILDNKFDLLKLKNWICVANWRVFVNSVTNLNLKKEVGITEETSSHATWTSQYTAMHHLLAQTHVATFSNTSTRFNPYFGWCCRSHFTPSKVGIKSCRCARECLILYMCLAICVRTNSYWLAHYSQYF